MTCLCGHESHCHFSGGACHVKECTCLQLEEVDDAVLHPAPLPVDLIEPSADGTGDMPYELEDGLPDDRIFERWERRKDLE